ncbi:hypothetical protein FEV16_16385 [Methylocystis sp. B8]|nr:hypothetical protein [Methylocystis sp. B8]TLG71264.1 hypothetical protein FEV16_16385 [Methylocystis sp. B8]
MREWVHVADDLGRATEMARAMVTRYGVSPDVGQASFARERSRYLDLPGASPQRSEASDQTSARIDQAISSLVEQAFERATEILRKCSAIHQDSAARPLEKESLSEEELAPIRRAVAACSRSDAHAARARSVEAAFRTILAQLRKAHS